MRDEPGDQFAQRGPAAGRACNPSILGMVPFPGTTSTEGDDVMRGGNLKRGASLLSQNF
jgi:hypothetical protein